MLGHRPILKSGEKCKFPPRWEYAETRKEGLHRSFNDDKIWMEIYTLSLQGSKQGEGIAQVEI